MLDKTETRLREIDARLAEVDTELADLSEPDELDDDQTARFNELTAEGSALVTEKAETEARATELRAIRNAAANPANLTPGDYRAPVVNQPVGEDLYDLSEIRAFGATPIRTELRGRALKAIETADDWEMDDTAKQRATVLLERHDDKRGTIAQMVLTTGSRRYKEAWAKAITGREMTLTGEERAMLAHAMEVRAMSQTDAAGGYAIPFPIDPTLIHTGDGSTNPFRQISRVVPGTSDTWQGVSVGAVSAGWSAEGAQAGDDTPTWAQPQVTAYKADMFIPASFEIVDDYPGLVGDLNQAFMYGKDTLETTAFSTGSGSAQPFGIVTAIDGTGNDQATATTDVYAVADVRTLHNLVGPRYRSQASWVMNNAIINATVAFGTSSLALQTLTLADGTAGLSVLGRPVYESSGMDGAIGAGEENNIVVFGDFQHYVIYDRVGFAVEYIPQLFHTSNNRPSGQRGWFAWWRVGADSVNDDAFALLNAT